MGTYRRFCLLLLLSCIPMICVPCAATIRRKLHDLLSDPVHEIMGDFFTRIIPLEHLCRRMLPGSALRCSQGTETLSKDEYARQAAALTWPRRR